MAQNLSERDLSAWLHSKLEEPWSSSKLAPLITKDIMKLIVDRFSLLDPAIKIRVMLAFLTMRKVMIKDMEAELLEIYKMGKEDNDEWVRVVASLLCTFPTQNMISYTDIQDNENYKKVFDDIQSKLESKIPPFYPLEYAYLNQSLFPKDLLQSVSANPHFTIKKPTPRLPPPAKKPVPIRKSIDMGVRPTSPEPASQQARATSPLLPRPTSPGPSTNKADIASKLFINRSKSRLTGSSNAKTGLQSSGTMSAPGANPKGLRESLTRLGPQPQKRTQMIGLEEIEMKQQQQEEERRLKQQQIEDEKRAKQQQIEEEKRAKQAKQAAEREAAEEAKKRKRAEKEKERAEGKKPRRKKQKLDNEEGEITSEQNAVEGEVSQSAQVNTSITTASATTVMTANVVVRTNGSAGDDFDYDAPMTDAKLPQSDEAARARFSAPISSLVSGAAPVGNNMSSLSLAERLTQSLGTFGQAMTQRPMPTQLPSVVPIPPMAMSMQRPVGSTDSASQMLSQVLNPMHSTPMSVPHNPHTLHNILSGNASAIPIPGEHRSVTLPPMHMPPQAFQIPGQPPQYSINDLPPHLQPQIQQLFAESPKLTEIDKYTIVKFLSQKEATGDKGPAALRTFLCNETIVGNQLEQFVFEINYGTGTWRKLKRKRTLQQTPSM